MSKVADLSIRHVLEEFHESVLVGDVEDVLGVIAGEGFFVHLFADAEESQVAFEIDVEEGFRSSIAPVSVDVPRVG